MSVILEARALSLVRGGRAVLRGVDIGFEAGAVTALVGPNGAGKSSLLMTLAGLLSTQSGEIRFEGANAALFASNERARKVAFLPQEREIAWPITVEDAVALGRFPAGGALTRQSDDDRAAIARAMQDADVAHLASRRLDRLSGGEQARVLLARALAVQAPVLLADEPLAGLDPAHQLETMAILRQRAEAGDTVVIALHDLTLVARFADSVVVLQDGEVAAQGAPRAALSDEILGRIFAIRVARCETESATFLVPWEVAAASTGFAPDDRK